MLGTKKLDSMNTGSKICLINTNSIPLFLALKIQAAVWITSQCRRLRDSDLIHGWGKSPGGGHGNPLQHSCLEIPMDRGA